MRFGIAPATDSHSRADRGKQGEHGMIRRSDMCRECVAFWYDGEGHRKRSKKVGEMKENMEDQPS